MTYLSWIILVILLISLIVFLTISKINEKNILENGIETEGWVISSEYRRKNHFYITTIKYKTNDNEIYTAILRTNKELNGLDKVKIRYLPSAPEKVVLINFIKDG